jgi:hypothetical protein
MVNRRQVDPRRNLFLQAALVLMLIVVATAFVYQLANMGLQYTATTNVAAANPNHPVNLPRCMQAAISYAQYGLSGGDDFVSAFNTLLQTSSCFGAGSSSGVAAESFLQASSAASSASSAGNAAKKVADGAYQLADDVPRDPVCPGRADSPTLEALRKGVNTGGIPGDIFTDPTGKVYKVVLVDEQIGAHVLINIVDPIDDTIVASSRMSYMEGDRSLMAYTVNVDSTQTPGFGARLLQAVDARAQFWADNSMIPMVREETMHSAAARAAWGSNPEAAQRFWKAFGYEIRGLSGEDLFHGKKILQPGGGGN